MRAVLQSAITLVYVVGPTLGLPNLNLPALQSAVIALRALGLTVYAAHENVAGTLAESLKRHTKAILDADAVVLLPGWENSAACVVEESLARISGKRVLLLEEALALSGSAA